MSQDREWMYTRYRDGKLTPEFLAGLNVFIMFACNQLHHMSGGDIKCPCKKCDNKWFHPPHVVRLHLVKNGFTPKYYEWWVHGEQNTVVVEGRSLRDEICNNPFASMVLDIGGAGSSGFGESLEEPPNPQAKHLFTMLEAANKELYSGCVNHSQLSFVARLMTLKSENHMSEKCFNQLLELIREIVPEDNCVPKDFYNTKKLLCGMGLPVEQIHSCHNHCMLFSERDADLSACKFCGTSRYKTQSDDDPTSQTHQVPHSKMYYFPLTPRLQRLYASRATAAEMRWHASSWDDGVMVLMKKKLLSPVLRNDDMSHQLEWKRYTGKSAKSMGRDT